MVVLILGIGLFAVSLIISFIDPSVSSVMLNFVATVIVSWLISNMANERAFKKKQEELAKVSYRHLEDVEKSALSIEQSIKDYLYDARNRSQMSVQEMLVFLKMLDSRMDDLKDRIKSTNRDWYDMLSDEVKNEIVAAADPEANIVTKPQAVLQHPDLANIADAYANVAEYVSGQH